MEHLTEIELKILYFNFTEYRDKFCNGMALIGVKDFYNKYGLESFKSKRCSMRHIDDINKDIEDSKIEMKEVKKEYGYMSHEYIDVHEEFCDLIDELSFTKLHAE